MWKAFSVSIHEPRKTSTQRHASDAQNLWSTLAADHRRSSLKSFRTAKRIRLVLKPSRRIIDTKAVDVGSSVTLIAICTQPPPLSLLKSKQNSLTNGLRSTDFELESDAGRSDNRTHRETYTMALIWGVRSANLVYVFSIKFDRSKLRPIRM